MSEPTLAIYNRYTAACEIPSALSNVSAELNIAYFANRHGEQWLFTFDCATRGAMLRGGGTDWEGVHAVRCSRAVLLFAPVEPRSLHPEPLLPPSARAACSPAARRPWRPSSSSRARPPARRAGWAEPPMVGRRIKSGRRQPRPRGRCPTRGLCWLNGGRGAPSPRLQLFLGRASPRWHAQNGISKISTRPTPVCPAAPLNCTV